MALQITKPTLLLNEKRALANIDRMVEKATRSGVRFRPHFKTHQSAEIGQWFRDKGVTAITVSSVDMALYFARHEWADITIAIPVNLRQLDAIDYLASRIKLGVVVESVEAVDSLRQQIGSDLQVWLKIDVGYHRTGLLWDDPSSIMQVARSVKSAKKLRVKGLLTHAGHTYGETSAEKIRAIYRQSLERMTIVQYELSQQGYDVQISVGDTPGCSLIENFGEVDEIRPGNFIFYDLSQVWFGSCREEDVALALACPVISKHAARNQIVIYGGAIHLSKESLPANSLTNHQVPIYGGICLMEDGCWSGMFQNSAIINLSQEHGVIDAEEQLFKSVNVGDLVAILPVHSCLTANLMGQYQTLGGKQIDMISRNKFSKESISEFA
ncbi:MAG TPA: alanine racemase [Chloroflexi bacterium]|nr:alanine racemase [Chloroflexota bacterium]